MSVALLAVVWLALLSAGGHAAVTRPQHHCEQGCVLTVQPVCGRDGRSYMSSCLAVCAGTTATARGYCKGAKFSFSLKSGNSRSASEPTVVSPAVINRYAAQGFVYLGQVPLSSMKHRKRNGPSIAAKEALEQTTGVSGSAATAATPAWPTAAGSVVHVLRATSSGGMYALNYTYTPSATSVYPPFRPAPPPAAPIPAAVPFNAPLAPSPTAAPAKVSTPKPSAAAKPPAAKPPATQPPPRVATMHPAAPFAPRAPGVDAQGKRLLGVHSGPGALLHVAAQAVRLPGARSAAFPGVGPLLQPGRTGVVGSSGSALGLSILDGSSSVSGGLGAANTRNLRSKPRPVRSSKSSHKASSAKPGAKRKQGTQPHSKQAPTKQVQEQHSKRIGAARSAISKVPAHHSGSSKQANPQHQTKASGHQGQQHHSGTPSRSSSKRGAAGLVTGGARGLKHGAKDADNGEHGLNSKAAKSAPHAAIKQPTPARQSSRTASNPAAGRHGSRSSKAGAALHRMLTVIGNDTRTACPRLAYPDSAIGQLAAQAYDGDFLCSGGLISASRVLTAAHCVWDDREGNGTFLQDIAFAPGQYRNDSSGGVVKPYGVAPWEHVTIFSGYAADPNGAGLAFDVAVIGLTQPVGQQTGWLGYKSECTTPTPAPLALSLAGYPGDPGPQNAGFPGGCLEDTCTVAYNCASPMNNHTCDSYVGQSGAPMFDSGYYTRMVHTLGVLQGFTTTNSGVTLTKFILDNIAMW